MACDYGRQAFLDAITHDDRNSYYIVARRKGLSGGESAWDSFATKAECLPDYGFSDKLDCYMTLNGFTSPSGRESQNCRQVNCVFADIDCHDLPDVDFEAIEKFVDVLRGAFDGEDATIPEPTLITFTGRGVHLIYVLDRSIPCNLAGGARSDRALKLYDDICRRLDGALTDLLAKSSFDGKVDGCVHDLTRLIRVPGTRNSVNDEICRVVYNSGKYPSLSEMSAFLPGRRDSQCSRRSSVNQINLDVLLSSRLESLRLLRDARGSEARGTRELMRFVYYNTAVQVCGSRGEAVSSLLDYNAGFSDPLVVGELTGIIRSVNRTGYYRFGKAKLISKLCLSEIEQKLFFSSTRAVKGAEMRAERAANREKRNSEIRRLYETGEYTQKEVAELTGCCERTVRNVLKGACRYSRNEALCSTGKKLQTYQVVPPVCALAGAGSSFGAASSRSRSVCSSCDSAEGASLRTDWRLTEVETGLVYTSTAADSIAAEARGDQVNEIDNGGQRLVLRNRHNAGVPVRPADANCLASVLSCPSFGSCGDFGASAPLPLRGSRGILRTPQSSYRDPIARSVVPVAASAAANSSSYASSLKEGSIISSRHLNCGLARAVDANASSPYGSGGIGADCLLVVATCCPGK